MSRYVMPSPWKNPATGILYLRQKVPVDLRETAKGRTLILPVSGKMRTVRVGDAVKVSLGTKDIATAKERFREADAALQEEWAKLRQSIAMGPVKLTQKQVMALAGKAYRAFTTAFDDEPGPAGRWVHVIRESLIAEQGGHLASLKIGGATEIDRLRALDEKVGGIVDSILQREGLSLVPDSRDRLIRATYGALEQAAILNLQKADGDYSPDPRASRFPEDVPMPVAGADRARSLMDLRSGAPLGGSPSSVAGPQARGGAGSEIPRLTITSLFDRWKVDAERRGGTERSAKRFFPVVRDFIRFLGHDDANRVTKSDIIRWREQLISPSPAPGGRTISATTFAKINRAALSAIFGKAVDLLLIPENPVAGIRVQTEKRTVLRVEKGFTKDEADAVLKAALAAPKAPGKTGKILRFAQRWVPWLCAYSGARVGEITQLRKQDIVESDGIWCILITPEAGTVKTKKARFLPIHSHLIDQGFLTWVDGRDDGPLFYSRDANSAQPWDATSSGLSEWIRKTVGITDPDLSPNHGWRHRFKTVADEVGIHPKYADAICGHAARSEGDRYGNRSVVTLKREIERLPRYEV